MPRKVLVEIAQKKQERDMLTQFKKYQDQLAKTAASTTGAAAMRKRTKTESLVNQVTETLTSLKSVLEEALVRAAKKSKVLA